MRRQAHWLVGAATWLALLTAPAAGRAERGGTVSSEDKAAAQVLFDQGRQLLEAKSYDEACPKFAESQRLDPAVGTLLNLARCYQLAGKTASAWINYLEAAAAAKRDGQAQREEVARKFAQELEPQLSKLTIQVPKRQPGMELKRDGAVVRESLWGTAVPVDPGEHEIVATAPGFLPWTKKITVEPNAAPASVEVGTLAVDPSYQSGGGTAGGGEPDVEPADPTVPLALGIVAGVLGLGGLGVGTAFGIIAGNKNDESLSACRPDDPNLCSQEGVDLRDEALTAGNVSTAGFIAGGVLLAAGIVLVATALASGDEGDEEQAPAAPAAEDREEQSSLELLPMLGLAPDPSALGGRPATMVGVLVRNRW